MARPWYPRYPDDYARKTAHLSFAEHGAYGLLMDQYYRTGEPLPNDPEALFRICRGRGAAERKALHSVINKFFEIHEDVLRLPRADEELARAQDIHEKRVKGGKCSAHARAHVGTPEPTNGQVRARAIQSQSQDNSLSERGTYRFVWEESRVPETWKQVAQGERQRLGLPAIDINVAASKFETWHAARPSQPRTRTEWRSCFLNFVKDENARQSRNSTGGALNRIARLHAEAREAESLGEV